MLSKEAVEEFKKIYFEQYQEELSDEKAYDLAMKVLRLFELLLKPEPPPKKNSPYE